MNEIGHGLCRLLKCRVWKWLVRASEDAVIGNAGVGDYYYVPLWHVAGDAVVYWSGVLTCLLWSRATGGGVTAQTLAVVKGRRFGSCRLDVGIMAGNATHLL